MKTLFETANDLLKAAEIPSEKFPFCDGWEGMMYKFASANDAVRAVNALSMLLAHEDSYPYLRIELENRPGSHTVTVIEGDEEWDGEDDEEEED